VSPGGRDASVWTKAVSDHPGTSANAGPGQRYVASVVLCTSNSHEIDRRTARNRSRFRTDPATRSRVPAVRLSFPERTARAGFALSGAIG
jgi:hypothetical protein